MDYELAVLFEAIQMNDEQLQSNSKQKLMGIREELMKLKAL